ncbi:cysteine desulfurase [Synechococcus sp. RSCCF101]|nr:cysteine desulfurase family protein [Synechococcus sp. RSCCF101]QEY33516.1 cysteine desulfurase [Synechococcus sp. RSCCF101]
MPAPLIYLDHQATTPCAAEVVAAMEPHWNGGFGNPASRAHRIGLAAAAAVDIARERIASHLDVPPDWVVFTSGATEANNLALKGLAETAAAPGHLVSVVSEHRAVLDPLEDLRRRGWELTLLPVDPDGRLDPARLDAAITPDTRLVSVMAANNEIGVIQPLEAIGRLCRSRGVPWHCDAAQAFGHMALEPRRLGIDLLSLSGHKLYGPKGIGALVVAPEIRLHAQLHGGGQERGLRAGTLPVPLIAGLAEASALAQADRVERQQRCSELRQRLLTPLLELGDVVVNGSMEHRLAHNLSVTVRGVNGAALHRELRRSIACSSGSACSAGEPSHVLAALGRSRREAEASLRLSLGRQTSEGEVDAAGSRIADVVRQLRRDRPG